MSESMTVTTATNATIAIFAINEREYCASILTAAACTGAAIVCSSGSCILSNFSVVKSAAVLCEAY